DGNERAIPDPWKARTDQRPGADPTAPYFASGHPPAIRLSFWTRHRAYSEAEKTSLPMLNAYWTGEEDLLVVSDFQWIGGHYGKPPSQTRRWWNRLRAWLKRSA